MLKVIYQPGGRAQEYNPWAANLYRGCGHGCVYCYAPLTLKMDRGDFSKPSPRPEIIKKLINDCAELRARGDRYNILLCFSCDPYQPINDHYQLTKQAIEILHFYGQSVAILTKGGYRALADMPLLEEGDEFAVTLTCSDDDLSRQWEPKAALPAERIDTLREAKARGLYTWVSLEPVLYPEQSLELIQLTHHFVDEFKLGKLNYHRHAETIDWNDYAIKACHLVNKLGKKYYVKEDLRKYLRVRDNR